MHAGDILMKMNICEKEDGRRSCEMEDVFADLYGEEEEILSRQRLRYTQAVEAFFKAFPDHGSDAEISVFSAPGRTEIGGNHTDHQHGRVLAAAIDLDAIAVVSENGENVIRLLSEGYPLSLVDLSDFSPREEERGTSSSLIRGVAASLRKEALPYGAWISI